MPRIKLIIGVVAIAGAAIFLMIEHQALVQLREANESLQQQLGRMVQLEADNERLSNLVAQASHSLPNDQLMELMKLRGEVGLLRRQTNELQTLREQTRQMRSELSSLNNSQNPNGVALPPEGAAQDIYPKTSWTNAGFATPEAAFQSLNYAVSSGDMNTLLASLSPDMQKDFAKRFEGKSESDVADEMKKGIQGITGFRILNRDILSDNEVVLSVSGEGGENSHQGKLDFQRIDGQWKLAQEK